MGVAAASAGAVYLAWRVGWTLSGGTPWLNLILLAVEGYIYLTMLGFLFVSWDTEVSAPFVFNLAWTVDIFIPTYNEPTEIIRATALAAAAVRYPHRTFILDDGRRPEIEELARELGCEYVARAEHRHAKAGNLNHALRYSTADFIAIFDADHAPQPTFLTRTLGYFCDPQLAVVQTPQDFYNLSSVQHASKHEHWHEQTLFYSVLQPGKNRTNSAFFCGSCAVLRREAVESIGGFATDSVTEDLLTSLRLHRAGWRSFFHRETLAYGIAPDDAAAFATQRLRWAQGTMQILRSRENPLRGPGLTVAQRISYAASMFTYFDSLARVFLMAFPLLVLAAGQVPYEADSRSVVALLGSYLATSVLAATLAQRGQGDLLQNERFAAAKMPIFLRAMGTLIGGGRRLRFAVTPKRATAGRRSPLGVVLKASSGVFVLSVLLGVLALVGYGPARTLGPQLVGAAVLWSALLSLQTWGASTVFRPAEARRGAYRFPWAVPVGCHSRRSGQLLASVTNDVSWNGMGMADPDRTLLVGDEVDVRLWLGDGSPLALSGVVRRVMRTTGRVGIEFTDPTPETRNRLILRLVTAGSAGQDRRGASRWDQIYRGIGGAA